MRRMVIVIFEVLKIYFGLKICIIYINMLEFEIVNYKSHMEEIKC